MWDLPGAGIEPVFPALAGGFLTIGPPVKSSSQLYLRNSILCLEIRYTYLSSVQFSSFQSLSRVLLFATPWITARQASLSITNYRSPTKPMSIESCMLKPGLENFEHYFARMWNECNCVVVWAFFGIAFLWDWNENWPFPVLWQLLSFPNLLTYWVLHFHGIIL